MIFKVCNAVDFQLIRRAEKFRLTKSVRVRIRVIRMEMEMEMEMEMVNRNTSLMRRTMGPNGVFLEGGFCAEGGGVGTVKDSRPSM